MPSLSLADKPITIGDAYLAHLYWTRTYVQGDTVQNMWQLFQAASSREEPKPIPAFSEAPERPRRIREL